MDEVMSETLKEIGWESGFRLPIANAENQKLEAELARLVIKKAALLKASEESKDKFNSLKNHVKYVKQETTQNQQMLTTYNQQLENQKHKLRLKTSERDKINSEIKNMEKELAEVTERTEMKRTALNKSVAKLEKIKAEAEWDVEAMKGWEESLKKREADNEILLKFSQEDQKRIAETEAKRQHLQEEVTGRKSMLEKMEVDISNYEQVLFRTGKMLQQLKEERQGLVQQWQESVKNLRQKDLDIMRTSKAIEETQEDVLQKHELIEEQETFLSQEINNNKYVEMEIQEKNIHNSRLRKENLQMVDENALMSNEHQAQKKMLEGLSHDQRRKQMQLKSMKAHSEKLLKRLETVKNELTQFKLESAKSDMECNMVIKNADHVESNLKHARMTQRKLEIHEANLHSCQYKLSCQTAELSRMADSKKSELESIYKALIKVRKHAKEANSKLILKKQLLSDLEMKVACLEAQIGSLEGEDDKDKVDVWNQRIEELALIVSQHNEVKHLLNSQILKLQKENLRLVSALSGDQDHHLDLKGKLQSFILMIEGGIKQAQAGKLRSQQRQVIENVLKLKVDKLGKAMSNANKEIYNLQQYRLDLETLINERHVEVTTAKDVLFAQKKNLEEDRGRLRSDISCRCVKIQQMINRYNISLGLLGQDESGNPISVAAFKLRTAQERIMLQQEGDDLDQKIRKAEGEIIAIENTIRVVNVTNKNFKENLSFVDDQSESAKALKELEFSIVDLNSLLRDKRKILMEIMQKITESKKEYEISQIEIKQSNDELCGLHENLLKLKNDETDRRSKIERAKNQIMHCKKKISIVQLEKYDKELYIRLLVDANKNVMYQLASFVQTNPEMHPILQMHMANHQLSMPKLRSTMSTISSDSICTPSSARSSRSGTSRDSKSTGQLLAQVTSLELKFDLDSLSSSSKSSASSKRH